MSLADYEEAVKLVQEHLEDCDVEPQPEERVEHAERTLGVQFPPSYRRFLCDLGAGGVGAEEIYGLVNDDFDDVRPPQAVGLTRSLRRDGHISDDLVVIYGEGQGSYYALDVSRVGPDGEAPVVAFTPGMHGAGDALEVVATDFGAFLLDVLSDELHERRAMPE